MKKGKNVITITIGLMAMFLVSIMFIQVKTINETNITDIENLRETELREQLSSWKTKYQEVNQKLEENIQKITDYKAKLDKNEETSELLDKELEQTNILLGKVGVVGEGVILTLRDNDEYEITSTDLLDLINELNYAGAEAISINDQRILGMTDIVDVGNTIIVGGKRLAGPYIVKAIGNQTYLKSTLSLKETGFIDKYNNSGKSVTMEESDKVIIVKSSNEIKIKYLEEVEEK